MALTPVKGKKALPSSKSTLFFEEPSCHSEWQTALGHVKIQFLKGDWKECGGRCEQLLQGAQDAVSKRRSPIFVTSLMVLPGKYHVSNVPPLLRSLML